MRLAAALIGCLLLAGCGHPEASFREVQFCLNGENDIARLKAVVRQIAQSRRLEFTDRSADAQAEAEDITNDPNIELARPRIVLSVYRDDGLGFGGGNFPEAPFQVVFGFGKGGSEIEAHKFADAVVQRLSRYWAIQEVPQGRGAFPLKKCDFVTPTA